MQRFRCRLQIKLSISQPTFRKAHLQQDYPVSPQFWVFLKAWADALLVQGFQCVS